MSRENSNIELLSRPSKNGLGEAYRDGFKHILSSSDVSRVIQMDADFSHPPEKLVAMIECDADLVIGSRYITNGSVANWGLHRRFLSRFGSFYAKLCLGVAVMDLTGGFKVWKRDLLEKVISQPLTMGGYAFQVETTYIAHKLGADIREIPITFTERVEGKSKMTFAIALEAFWRVPALAYCHRSIKQE
jgi:dolichol-phosphate mannosyltransferase